MGNQDGIHCISISHFYNLVCKTFGFILDILLTRNI